MKRLIVVLFALVVVAGIVGVYFLWISPGRLSSRSKNVLLWLHHPQDYPQWSIQALSRCGDAPFIMPTSGFIGYLWDDSFRPGHSHQGIDIFGGSEPGQVPVFAVADGYVTRLPDWKSTVIIRLDADPLGSGQQTWTYYTHMAYETGESLIVQSFPPGTAAVFVKAGTLLGYQGNYSGTPGNPTGVHLHFSIVRGDGKGSFLNELEIENTLDPSPYLNLELNAGEDAVTPVSCSQWISKE